MIDTSQSVQSYLAKASSRFREVHGTLGRTILELFPEAKGSFEPRLPGWKIPRRRHVDPASVKGTIDPNWVHVYLAERKAGITLHLWNPVDFRILQRRKPGLERAGFKVMVGCIQFNRKSEYPIGDVVELLKEVKESLEVDGRGTEPPKGGSPARTLAPAKQGMSEALRRELDEWAAEPPMDGGD